MNMKPVTKMQKEFRIKQRNKMLKSFKLPATIIRKLNRLASIKSTKQVNHQVDFEFEKIIMPKIEEAIYFTIIDTPISKIDSLFYFRHNDFFKFKIDLVIDLFSRFNRS